MSRLIIIAFEILALVALLRSPFSHFLFASTQQHVADWMLELSLVTEKQKLRDFRRQLNPAQIQLNDYQMDYLNSITVSKSSLINFNQRYCQAKDKNPYIYGANLDYLCTQIATTNIDN